jgi:CRISPR-associated endoribonuclease Cas6
MPAKVRFVLNAEKPLKVKELTPDRLHGLFFSLLQPEVADIFHQDYKGLKVFSLFSPQLWKDPNEEINRILIEVSLLKDDLLPKLLSSYLLSEKREFRLGGVKLTKSLKPMINDDDIVSYESLLNTQPTSKRFFKFLAPTTFRRNKIDFPFPEPEILFKSILKRWIVFSGIKPDVDLRKFYQQVEITKYKLNTRKVELSSLGKLTTFVGVITYHFGDIEDQEAARWFSILSNFANFSGVGRKTAMGLGKVKSFPEKEEKEQKENSNG